MKITKRIFLIILLSAITVVAIKVYNFEMERRNLKEDLVELSMVRYGLMSVDKWKEIISNIITQKVQELDLEGKDKAAMEAKISGLLYQLMDEYEASYKKEKSKSIGGIIQGAVAGFTGVFGKMRREVPNFTKTIMDFMENPENRENLRLFIIEKIESYTDETFSPTDYSAFEKVLTKYNATTKEDAILKIHSEIGKHSSQQGTFNIVIFALIGLLLVFLFMSRKIEPMVVLISTLICGLLLWMGINLPMIDIDARIADMKFTLLGEQIHFQDQILFYKSKSILEVTQLMLEQGKWDVLLVGLLILLFSVIFPISKLLAGLLYSYWSRMKEHSFIKFLVFKTGKWSMADVMVVAIFMSFIGFSGIISEQLRQLEGMAVKMEILTTNASQLQVGFFLFTSFVICSLVLSHKLQYQFKK